MNNINVIRNENKSALQRDSILGNNLASIVRNPNLQTRKILVNSSIDPGT